MMDISEHAFEEAIECALLAGGPDAGPADMDSVREFQEPFGKSPSGGYLLTTAEVVRFIGWFSASA